MLEPTKSPEPKYEDNATLENDPQLKEYWCGYINEQDQEGYPCIQVLIDDNLAKEHFELHPDDNLQAVMLIYATTVKTTVIRRDTDILTKDEENTHWKELQAAMLEELKIWVKYKCFHMRLNEGARNIMDSRNVLKWKWIKDDKGLKKRIIRCRVALRGFKDRDADILETHAGTACRTSQRLLTSEAANHPEWEFLTIDVNKAFLQGATYQELEQLTGDAPREVCFYITQRYG
jgi:hypothetical protein